jgi:AraC-like DNA-binding protein
MAPSTFYRHFREITLFSPLQYQKQLRLHEAQRLILVEKQYVSTAALAVGYENIKQFSREYKRFFGEPPSASATRARKTFFGPV